MTVRFASPATRGFLSPLLSLYVSSLRGERKPLCMKSSHRYQVTIHFEHVLKFPSLSSFPNNYVFCFIFYLLVSLLYFSSFFLNLLFLYLFVFVAVCSLVISTNPTDVVSIYTGTSQLESECKVAHQSGANTFPFSAIGAEFLLGTKDTPITIFFPFFPCFSIFSNV